MQEARNHGIVFTVSPWALTWDDENYYLVAFDDYDQKIKHYRVDKMKQLKIFDETRLGKDITIVPIDENNSYIHVDVAISPQFFGWILSLGEKVKITGPGKVVDEMKNYVQEFLDRY